MQRSSLLFARRLPSLLNTPKSFHRPQFFSTIPKMSANMTPVTAKDACPRESFIQLHHSYLLALARTREQQLCDDEIRLTSIFPAAGPYSQAIRANGQIFVSGQIPADASGNLVQGNIGTLTQACCDNIQAIVTAAGSSVSKIVKVNVFLTDMANFAEMNATYEKFFIHKPARSCVAVAQLPKGVPVEIECIALE
ncbi:protein MMF1 mitochondrial precursor [Penicillium argentinense]|uniref:Protein MMF1 mitochondrial n=1 Tax=Penicillium argentinense TaxID=1131581 RepID=A0A9W9KLF9_9EURO|nr:protein MMF1 mitochondrial precursor [Penicillium argentinense]KAJ5109768.1 protein MMF1 mitochondrial precursor [Penicillium argentinense]